MYKKIIGKVAFIFNQAIIKIKTNSKNLAKFSVRLQEEANMKKLGDEIVCYGWFDCSSSNNKNNEGLFISEQEYKEITQGG